MSVEVDRGEKLLRDTGYMALHWNIESREKLVVVVADGNVEMEEAERATWAVSAIVSTGSKPPVITCRAAWDLSL